MSNSTRTAAEVPAHKHLEGPRYPRAQTTHQWKLTPEGVPVQCPGSPREGVRSGPPPRLAVEDLAGRKENELTLPLIHVTNSQEL